MLLDITKVTNLTSDIWQLDLTGHFPYEQVQPGQFINILLAQGYDHLLRRPISIAEVDPTQQRLTIVFRVVGQGTEWLSKRQVGDQLDIMGPLGSGFSLPPQNSKVIVVGGGIGIPPLYQLTKELSLLTKHIQIVLGFRDQGDCFWLDRFRALGQLVVATEDGSQGEQGYVTDVINPVEAYDYLYSCGPLPMLKGLKQHFQNTDVQGYVSLEERMACGVGACYGCVCSSEDKKTNLRICKEGPVFPWKEVTL